MLSSAVAFALATNGTKEPLEATAQMERLAAKVESAKSVDPDTADKIARLVDQPWYDCSQVTCSEKLQARNGAVRSRLKTLMATKAPTSSVAGIGKQEPGLIDAEAITTSAVGASR